MCVVSMIHDVGRTLPPTYWTTKRFYDFQHLIDEAKKFDEESGQPDCEDPEKTKFMREILDRLNKMDKRLDETDY